MKTREQIAQALAASGYIADAELATAISLMQLLKRPLLLEGEAGVGKTEVAKALASVHATELIRLQCYEGLDQSAALYEWNYQRQLLAIQAHLGGDAEEIEDKIFSEKYLLERPLLAAIRRDRPPVLLIDEIDRAGILAAMRLDRQQLTLVIPFIECCRLIEALIALQANELGRMR